MVLARIIGTVVATRKDPRLEGKKLLICRQIDPDGKGASRVPVKLGRTSVSTIEILDGLKVGDRVILSDMSAMDGHDRIRLN